MSLQVGHTREARDAYDVRIADLTRKGYTAAFIAQALNLTTRTVQRSRRRMGVAQPAVPRFTDDELTRAKEMFDDGCSRKEVARTLGRSEEGVAARFPDRGWSKAEVAEFASWQRKMRSVSSSMT